MSRPESPKPTYFVISDAEKANFRFRVNEKNQEFVPIKLVDGNWVLPARVLERFPQDKVALLSQKIAVEKQVTDFQWKADYDARRASAATSSSNPSASTSSSSIVLG